MRGRGGFTRANDTRDALFFVFFHVFLFVGFATISYSMTFTPLDCNISIQNKINQN